MTALLAIDGSIRCVGLAYFVVDQLRWTGHVRWAPRPAKGTNIAQRAQILAWEARGALPDTLLEVPEIVYEWPQAYGDDKNPNDLFGMVAVSAYLAGWLRSHAVTGYLPREWTGGIPKATKGDPHKSPRAAKISARLSVGDLPTFCRAATHDEIDAVGIGLHHLGRSITTRRRVIDRE